MEEKQKKSIDKKTIVEIILTILMIRLFGVVGGAVGIAVTYALDKKLKAKNPDAKWVFPVCCLVGVIIAVVIALILAIIFNLA